MIDNLFSLGGIGSEKLVFGIPSVSDIFDGLNSWHCLVDPHWRCKPLYTSIGPGTGGTVTGTAHANQALISL